MRRLMLVRVGKRVMRLRRVSGEVVDAWDGDRKMRSFYREKVRWLCGDCTTRWDNKGKVKQVCEICEELELR